MNQPQYLENFISTFSKRAWSAMSDDDKREKWQEAMEQRHRLGLVVFPNPWVLYDNLENRKIDEYFEMERDRRCK